MRPPSCLTPGVHNDRNLGWKMNIDWSKVWKWIRDNALGGIVGSALLAIAAWLIGLLALPATVEDIQKDVATLESDTKSLLESRGKLQEAAENAKNQVSKIEDAAKDFSTKTGTQLDTLRTSTSDLTRVVDDLKTVKPELAKLREAADSLKQAVDRLDATVKGIEAIVGQSGKVSESTIVVSLTREQLVEQGQTVWEFRHPISKDVGPIVGIVRVEPTNWPPIVTGVSLEVLPDGDRLRIILRGNVSSLAPIFMDNSTPLPVRIIVSVPRR
jgi:hypothetical protein